LTSEFAFSRAFKRIQGQSPKTLFRQSRPVAAIARDAAPPVEYGWLRMDVAQSGSAEDLAIKSSEAEIDEDSCMLMKAMLDRDCINLESKTSLSYETSNWRKHLQPAKHCEAAAC